MARRYVRGAAPFVGVRVGLAVAVAAAVAGCSGGGGRTAASTTHAGPTHAVPATTTRASTDHVSTTNASTAPATGSIVGPKVAKDAQGAVDAYIAYLRAAAVVEADPGSLRRGDLNVLLGAKAKQSINASLDALGRAGIGYRGIPPDPRLKVVRVRSSKLVLLSSCPLQSEADPYRQVVLGTGQPVLTSDRRPGPPYQRTLTMFHNKKRWVLIKYSDDTSRTCTG